MDVDPVVSNLLMLYAGVILINVGVSAALYLRNREPLYRSLLLAWAAMFGSFALQGVLTGSELAVIVGFSSAFTVNLAFASLLGATTSVGVPWRAFLGVFAAGLALTVALSLSGAGFTVTALPTALAVAVPSLVVVAGVARGPTRPSTPTLALAAGAVLFSLHNVDFAFLRHRPEMAPLGFTVALLVVFGLSIAGPAVAMERVTERQVRLATELAVARRIQSYILPRDPGLASLEVALHVRSAAAVSGDYIDVYRDGERCWFLLGDVTGHGLGAGLVMLMAQSTMSSLLQARPELTPRELNFLANRVLAGNLARLRERRHLSSVSLLRLPGNRFVVSGSHDGLLVYRASTGRVDQLELSHFPVGLGYLGELAQDDFR